MMIRIREYLVVVIVIIVVLLQSFNEREIDNRGVYLETSFIGEKKMQATYRSNETRRMYLVIRKLIINNNLNFKLFSYVEVHPSRVKFVLEIDFFTRV